MQQQRTWIKRDYRANTKQRFYNIVNNILQGYLRRRRTNRKRNNPRVRRTNKFNTRRCYIQYPNKNKQWQAFPEEIKDHDLLVELTNNIAVLAYSINKQTTIRNGIKHSTNERDKLKHKNAGIEAVSTPLDLTYVLD